MANCEAVGCVNQASPNQRYCDLPKCFLFERGCLILGCDQPRSDGHCMCRDHWALWSRDKTGEGNVAVARWAESLVIDVDCTPRCLRETDGQRCQNEAQRCMFPYEDLFKPFCGVHHKVRSREWTWDLQGGEWVWIDGAGAAFAGGRHPDISVCLREE